MSIIEVKGVSFKHGSTKVLEDVTFSVDKGDFVGLIGPNGSGKTTLLKLMLGIYPMQEGSIRILGQDIRDFSKHSKLGYVPQKAAGMNTDFPATVKEVVAMGLLSTKKHPKIIKKTDRRRIDSALEKVSMQQFKERRIDQLSGGQQQRVLIAKALVSSPAILFLDEPTTGIDQQSQEQFYDLLSKLNKSGITIMLVTHDTGRITRHVTKLASLNMRLDFYGTHKEFCALDKEHHFGHTHSLCLLRE